MDTGETDSKLLQKTWLQKSKTVVDMIGFLAKDRGGSRLLSAADRAII